MRHAEDIVGIVLEEFGRGSDFCPVRQLRQVRLQ